MKIANKLLLAVGLTCSIVMICILIPLATVSELSGVGRQLGGYEALQEEVALSLELQLQVANVWQFITDASLTREQEVIDKEARPAYDRAMQLVTKLLDQNRNDTAHTARIKQIQQALPTMWQTGITMFQAYGQSHAEGNRAMDVYDKACDSAIKAAAEISGMSTGDGRSQMKTIKTNLSSLTKKVNYGGGAAVMFGFTVIVLMVLVRRSIVFAINRILAEVRLLTCGEGGDLTNQIQVASKDEIGELATSINRLILKLRDLIAELYDEGAKVATRVCEMDRTAQATVVAAVSQKEEGVAVAAAAEEMASTLNGVAVNTHKAAAVAFSVNQAAECGMAAVEEACRCMESIREGVEVTRSTVERLAVSSRQIGEIAGMIEDIADQTNLLALNAAIEAARAGEHGRGFAVVADEVKNLSSKTGASTREITSIISAIQLESQMAVQAMETEQARVSEGVTTAQAAREALDSILRLAVESTEMVNQIATATEEQSVTTGEITEKIHRISNMAQQVDTEMRKTEKTLQGLSIIAQKIYATVGRFSVGNYHDLMKNFASELGIRVSEALEKAVAGGTISMEHLFTRTYTPLPNTSPQKHKTTFDALFDRIISPIQEDVLAKNGDIVFAICVDDHGYVSSHNLKFSKPLTGDPEVDNNHNRTKRIFNDKTGLRAAQNSGGFLLQTYLRDTGEIMNDLSFPITVGGRHWGAVRIGYKAID